ncbi:hypothetical protein NEMBOFW57_010616 [Staphylotrichum longicolle]|uniref:DUF7735 domain-containing protein n=1 Tax=Staphylotrichum longicolle TaxID=669026 RepID=A0AAD4HUF2_9PEZI|nr:hypothetical protein NEMBOFW57_010616 [Staphylotrichum longicolle]
MRNAALVAALGSSIVAALTTSADYTELHPVVAPTAFPDVSETTDPWQCATEDPMKYLSEVPMPTGGLHEAQISFGSSLIQTCLTSGTFKYPCAYPDQSLWCGFTTAMPASLLPDYSSYASSAASWWAANSASVIHIATMCPIMWYQASNFGVLGGAIYLNQTLINSICYAEANPTVTGSATGPTPTPGQSASEPASTSTSAIPSQTSSMPNPGEPCNGGTNADGESENFMGLCSFACHYGYCPPGPCKCTSYGTPGTTPPTNGRDGCPLPGESEDKLLAEDGTVLVDGYSMEPYRFSLPRDDFRADVKTDLFALGCTIYFILLGHTIFPDIGDRDKEAWEKVEERLAKKEWPREQQVYSAVTVKCWEQ